MTFAALNHLRCHQHLRGGEGKVALTGERRWQEKLERKYSYRKIVCELIREKKYIYRSISCFFFFETRLNGLHDVIILVHHLYEIRTIDLLVAMFFFRSLGTRE